MAAKIRTATGHSSASQPVVCGPPSRQLPSLTAHHGVHGNSLLLPFVPSIFAIAVGMMPLELLGKAFTARCALAPKGESSCQRRPLCAVEREHELDREFRRDLRESKGW